MNWQLLIKVLELLEDDNMSVSWGWADFWACYKANPERLQREVDWLPEWLATKSTRVQLEIIRDAPPEIIKQFSPVLTFDCQITLMR